MQTQQNLDNKEPIKQDQEKNEESAELKGLKHELKKYVEEYFKRSSKEEKFGHYFNLEKFSDNQKRMVRQGDFEIYGFSHAEGNEDKINFSIFGHEMSMEGDAVGQINKKN